ncbi:Chaperone DnaJ, C-terminal [Artemisia annua]|uniref:Chaperone DnaJ, C-terminal n=1 Tax=Artemisia annua TaxID=35608 RepID=A0A2U1KJ66_ARTAN|nr:Chaperone DnaJ, C-terminal [Artemisia annua]
MSQAPSLVNLCINTIKNAKDNYKRAIYDQYGKDAALLDVVLAEPSALPPAPLNLEYTRSLHMFFEKGPDRCKPPMSCIDPNWLVQILLNMCEIIFYAYIFCNERVYSKFRGVGGSAEGSASTTSSKAAAIEKTLPFSLEDLYKGTTKKLKISRDLADWTG